MWLSHLRQRDGRTPRVRKTSAPEPDLCNKYAPYLVLNPSREELKDLLLDHHYANVAHTRFFELINREIFLRMLNFG